MQYGFFAHWMTKAYGPVTGFNDWCQERHSTKTILLKEFYVQLVTVAINVTLLVCAADHHAAVVPLLLGAGRAAINRYLLPAESTAENYAT